MTKDKKIIPNLDPITLGIIFYLIEKLDGVLGKTHLQKMLFLTDLLATKKFKSPLTKLEFEKFHFGPYSDKVDDYVEHLKNKSLITVKEFPIVNLVAQNRDKFYTRYYCNKKGLSQSFIYKKFQPEKIILLNEIIDSFGNISLQQVLDVVYSLETVRNAKNNTPLKMAKIIENEEIESEADLF